MQLMTPSKTEGSEQIGQGEGS
jgi:hypothetical protein